MIYFLQAKVPKGIGPIKIGYTANDNVDWRVYHLQIGCPYELVVLRTTPGTMADEHDLHRMFKPLRMRGEWFEGTPELLEFALAMPQVDSAKYPGGHEVLDRPAAQVVSLADRRAVAK